MSATGILGHGRTVAQLEYRRSGVTRCATCNGRRDLSELEHAAFCRDCLDRSRIDDDDDIGGES